MLTNNARLCFIGAFALCALVCLRKSDTLGFCVGRRVLKTYLLLFLNSSPALKASHDFEYIQDRALNTYVLGEYVAPQWQLGKVLKWTPATTNGGILDPTTIGRDASRSVGLYKVQGTAVEAAVGGVFHQFVRLYTIFTLTSSMTNTSYTGWLCRTSPLPHTTTATYSPARQDRRPA